MLRGEQLERGAGLTRLAARGRLSFAFFRTEVALGSPVLTTIGLIALALVLQILVLSSPGHFRPADSLFFALFEPFGILASLGLCLLAALPIRCLLSVRVRQAICLAGFLSLAVLAGAGISHTVQGVTQVVQGQPYTNDGAVMDLYAVKQVLRHHDPYLKANIARALADLNAPAITTTPLMEGQFRGAAAYPSDAAQQQAFLNDQRLQPRTIPAEFESKYNYPAGSFLFILPFVWAGIHDMRFLYAIAILLMGWYIAHRLPRGYMPLVPFIVLADVPLVVMTAGGQPDPLYALPLLLGYAEWNRRWTSPLAMGLAIAIKQLAWFFVPFYLVLVARRYGVREALRRSAIMGAVFLVLNGPFIISSPGGYVASVGAPMSDPMFPLGVGIVSLFVAGVLPMVSKLAFTVGELASWAGTTILSWRMPRLPVAAGAVFAALPLFFAYRSLMNYFYLVPLLTLGIIAAEQARQRARSTNPAIDEVAA